jgi:hypothetical protein
MASVPGARLGASVPTPPPAVGGKEGVMKIDWQMVSALATVIYTGGTFLLWWTTRRALKDARDAFHDVEESVAEGLAGLEPWVAASETRRERTLALLQKVFPDEWTLLASPNRESSARTRQSRGRGQA